MTFFHKLQLKIIAGTLFILALTLFALGSWLIHLQSAQLLEHRREQGRQLAKLLAQSSLAPLQKYSFFQLQEFAIQVEQSPQVAFCEIYDAQGRSLVQTETNVRGERQVKKKHQSGEKILSIEEPIRANGETLGKVEIGFYLDDVQQQIKRETFRLGLALLIGLGLVAGLLYAFLSYVFVSPIIDLSKVTKTLGEGQFVKTNIELRHDQIGQLARSFNEMSYRLERFYQKLVLAQTRAVALRRFSNQLADFTNDSQMLRAAFQQICQHIQITQAVLFFDAHDSGFRQQIAYPGQAPWPENPEGWSSLFTEESPQLAIFNQLQSATGPLTRAEGQAESNLQGVHLVYAHSQALRPHLIGLLRSASEEEFDEADLEYIQGMLHEINIAQQNITAIREKTRMESELRTAAAVQQALFPKNLPKVERLEIATFFQSASETGGDWYGFITQIQDTCFILIGDVTGHGTPAALVAATASATCRTLERVYAQQQQMLSPAELLGYLNQAVFLTGFPEFLMTFFAARLELKTGLLTFCNAGHNFPVCLRANGNLQYCLNTNHRLGFQPETQFQESTLHLQAGDLLFFYTDGLIENSSPQGEMWGNRRLVQMLKQNSTLPVKSLVAHLVESAYTFYDSQPLEDDLTLVACRYLP